MAATSHQAALPLVFSEMALKNHHGHSHGVWCSQPQSNNQLKRQRGMHKGSGGSLLSLKAKSASRITRDEHIPQSSSKQLQPLLAAGGAALLSFALCSEYLLARPRRAPFGSAVHGVL